MSPSKLDAKKKARDHRRDDERRHKRKRHHHKDNDLPVHVDLTSIVFASQQPDSESRIVVLDVLPDMDDEWIDKIVYLRNPSTGETDRAYMGIQNLDDTLVWIELTLATPAVIGSSPPDPSEPAVATYVRRFGSGTLGTAQYFNSIGISPDGAGNIWVADPANDRAVRFLISTGVTNLSTSGTAPTGAEGLVYNTVDGKLYVADNVTSNCRIRVYTGSTGVFSANIANAGPWTGDNELMRSLSLNAAGTQLAVTLPRDNAGGGSVQKVTIATGAIAATYIDAIYYPYPSGADYDTTGNLFVCGPGGTSVHTDAHRLTKLSTTGTVTDFVGGFAGTASGKFNDPRCTFVDRTNNRVYVSDSANHRVQIFDATTLAYLGKFGTGPGSGAGEMWYPSGMVLIGTSLYVVNNNLQPAHADVSEWTINL